MKKAWEVFWAAVLVLWVALILTILTWCTLEYRDWVREQGDVYTGYAEQWEDRR